MYSQTHTNPNAKLDSIEFEVVATTNPLNLTLNNVGRIIGIELETFDYLPTNTPLTNYIGVTINGLQGRFNSLGNKINTLRTIPLNNGRFHFDAGKDDVIALNSNQCNLEIGFINKYGDSSNSVIPSYFVFNNNYLLNFSLIVEKF